MSLCHGISTERYKFRLPFPAKKASRAYLGNTIHETQRKKKGCLMRARLRTKTTQISPFFCCIPVFQYSNLSFPYLADLTILCQFFSQLGEFRKKLAGELNFFVIFVCIKGYQSSDSFPFKEAFVKRVLRSKTVRRQNPSE